MKKHKAIDNVIKAQYRRVLSIAKKDKDLAVSFLEVECQKTFSEAEQEYALTQVCQLLNIKEFDYKLTKEQKEQFEKLRKTLRWFYED